MQKITIIAVGSLREEYFKNAYAEYVKRISKFAKLELVLIKETNSLKEGEEILKQLSKFKITQTESGKDSVYVLNIKGTEYSSEAFAENLIKDKSHLIFIIGGSDGLSESVSKSGFNVSFGKLTFPHQLMRVFLVEQIYRSFKILNGHKYHK
ncbi:MAG: 23S rRNA (pseudouridine(1915)-N(3))-methyltransferase RlmH [Defluviitaleaceae bacterium]|nr:23S rRNA (pseudouridine(1915)-N(3))-methyltransferase RlmH [Defluviitaleaceae bacterium]